NIEPSVTAECSNPEDQLRDNASIAQYTNYAVQNLHTPFRNPNPDIKPTEVKSIEIVFESGFRPQLTESDSKEPGTYKIYLSYPKNDTRVWWQLGHELGHLINPTAIHPFAEGFASAFGFQITKKCGVPNEKWLGFIREQTPTTYGATYRLFKDVADVVDPRILVRFFTEPEFQNLHGALDMNLWLNAESNFTTAKRRQVFNILDWRYKAVYSLREEYSFNGQEFKFEPIKNNDTNQTLEFR
ncbi:MAG: hypothetical protein AB7O96_07215, partial [Pseudobdellovibrionaceae bacterium]